MECWAEGIRGRGGLPGRLVGKDERPPFCSRSEDAGVAQQMGFWSRDERRQFFQKLQRREDHRTGRASARPVPFVLGPNGSVPTAAVLDAPQTLRMDSNGNLVVFDAVAGQILRFRP